MCVFACTFCLNCQCYSSNDISNDQEAIYYSLCKALYTFIYLRNLKEKSQKIYEKKKPLNLLYQELNTTISIIQKKKKNLRYRGSLSYVQLEIQNCSLVPKKARTGVIQLKL